MTARAYIEKSLELDPHLLPALLSYSQMLLEDRAYLEAIPLLERAVAHAPENSSLLVNLGAAYRGVGRGEEAIEVTERAAAIAPSSGSVVFNLGLLYGDVRLDYEKAISTLNQYTTAGGPASLRANAYIKSFEKSKERAVKKRAAESVNQQREAEIADRTRLLEEAAREEAEEAQQSTPPVAAPAPAVEPQTTPTADDPWGTAK